MGRVSFLLSLVWAALALLAYTTRHPSMIAIFVIAAISFLVLGIGVSLIHPLADFIEEFRNTTD